MIVGDGMLTLQLDDDHLEDAEVFDALQTLLSALKGARARAYERRERENDERLQRIAKQYDIKPEDIGGVHIPLRKKPH